MKDGVSYIDIAREIVSVLSKYEVTYFELKTVKELLDKEILIHPVQHPTVGGGV